jgi:hypothetical protein
MRHCNNEALTLGSIFNRPILLTAAALLLAVPSAHASSINDIDTNISFATAQNVEGNFSSAIGAPTVIPNTGVAGWEWVSIQSTGDGDNQSRTTQSFAYYSFQIALGQKYIFDIDYGDENISPTYTGDFDALLTLYQDDGTILAENDDLTPPDPGSVTNYTDSGEPYTTDSYLVFDNLAATAYAGKAFIRVARFDNVKLDYDKYQLQIARVVPVPAAVWLFGTALIGFIVMSRRTTVKA